VLRSTLSRLEAWISAALDIRGEARLNQRTNGGRIKESPSKNWGNWELGVRGRCNAPGWMLTDLRAWRYRIFRPKLAGMGLDLPARIVRNESLAGFL